MPTFEYKALDKAGAARAGRIDADTARDARLKLRKDQLLITDIREAGAVAETPVEQADKRPLRLSLFGRVSPEEISLFTRQLATMLRAGIPLTQALKALIEQTPDSRIERILRDILEKVTQGKSMADAMAHHPRMFNELYVNMVRAGEATGAMDEVLMRLADYIQKQTRLQNKIQGALAYPMILMTVGVGVVFFLMKYVVPKILVLLKQNRQTLPLPTQILVKLSAFIGAWWWLMLLAVIGVVTAYKLLRATPAGGLWIDGKKLKMPIFGPLISKSLISRFAVTLSILLKSGIPALQALRIVKQIVTNKKLASTIDTIHDRIVEGADIAGPLKQSGVFPPVVAYMISVGEQSGQLEEILQTLAAAYDEEVEFATQRMVTLLEPVMIISLAVVVGFIVLSIIIPITNMSRMG